MRKLLLAAFLLVLVGCNIAKRRYTGGYSISWHTKSVDKRVVNHIQEKLPVSNKIVGSTPPAIQHILPKKDKSVSERVKSSFAYSNSEKLTPNTSSTYLPSYVHLPHDSITFDDTSIYKKPSRMAPPTFGFLSMLSGASSYVFVEILALSGYAGIYLLLPIGALFLTILFAYYAMHKARILLKDYHLDKDRTWSIIGIVLASIGLLIGLLGLIGTLILLGA